MNRPTIQQAAEAVTARKRAANTELVDVSDLAWGAALSGTDLTRDEVQEFCNRQGTERGPLVVILGPASLAATCVADGILVGLELARLRDQAERRVNRLDLKAALLELAETVLEADDAGELITQRLTTRQAFRLAQEGAGAKGAEARDLAERILEQIGRTR